jgi:WS/DGAT/MGAT family acyltransferase
MSATSYERLSAQDSSFVLFERSTTPMHVAAIAIFEAGPLATGDGGVDAERIAKHVESRLHRLPRYRRKLAATPVEGHPIWVDDDRFDLRWHLRRVALPRPGSEGELRELVGRILSQPLERARPLWEMWIVEGIERGRFALVSKVHHCMVDGVSGANLLTLLFNPSPDEEPEVAPRWRPLPAPGRYELLLDLAGRRLSAGAALARGLGGALRDPRRALARAVETGRAVAEALEAGVRLPAPNPLNGPIGAHRRVEWVSLDLTAAKAIKNRLGGTVNDVVLAVVSGALHRFLGRSRAWPARFDYRIVVPVNMRAPGDLRAANQVSALFLSLPVAERDPLARFARIRAETERLKRSRAAEGIELMTALADRFGPTWLTRFGVSLVNGLRPYNLIVTNVPGPAFPLYVLGARLLELYPQLPLFEQQGLGVAVLSYDGRLGFGLIADWERVPELARLREALAEAFEELEAASRAARALRAMRGRKSPADRRPPAQPIARV